MDPTSLKKHQTYIVVACLLVFMGLALLLRFIPVWFIKEPGFLYLFDTDSWYTLRQVEVMVRNFPQYNWFDPMTAYPTGKIIDWGPLYPAVAALVCLITGATTRSSIIFTSGIIAPLMAAVMVPLMYYLGKTAWDGKTGIVSAGLISIISFQYFTLSSYGWNDHHIAEVLFSTFFFLTYILTLLYVKNHPVDLYRLKTLQNPLFFSGITGMVFFLAILVSPTVILTLIIVAFFTLVQSILDYFENFPSSYLLTINGIFLGVSVILLFLFGFRHEGLSLTQYSIGMVYAQVSVILATAGLFFLARVLPGKKIAYIASLVILIAGSIALMLNIPQLQMITGQVLGVIFGSSLFSVAVVETLPWTLNGAWDNFNVSLILMAGGLICLGHAVVKKRTHQSVFLLIWSLVMLLLTIRFQRFAYFFTVNVALLTAICITTTISWREDLLSKFGLNVNPPLADPLVSPQGENEETPRKKKIPQKKDTKKSVKTAAKSLQDKDKYIKTGIAFFVIILTVILLFISISQDLSYGLETPQHEISSDWQDSLTWLRSNTPETGIDYFKKYESRGFSYPPGSYGIIAVWDAGHWITFFAHRIPVSNPFQDNLGGSSGTAAYFLSLDESHANDILHTLGGKYVITNSDMAIDTFTNLVPWQNNSVDISPYIKWFMLPNAGNPLQLQKIHQYDKAYFQTMVNRLHNFDGSMQIPNNANYVEYSIRQVPAPGETSEDVQGYARVISRLEEKNISVVDNGTHLASEGKDLFAGMYAGYFSNLPNQTLLEFPALRHYRLIYESPTDATVKIFPESAAITLHDSKTVKIFEYVSGARISGNGIIELPVVTNTGRSFIYRQASEGGEFIVPYSTEGNPYAVRATGKYHIAGTSQFISVTEQEVTQGNRSVR
jgi:dolichyl-diphosphooligosaccharide--protein glycosyltransferase